MVSSVPILSQSQHARNDVVCVCGDREEPSVAPCCDAKTIFNFSCFAKLFQSLCALRDTEHALVTKKILFQTKWPPQPLDSEHTPAEGWHRRSVDDDDAITGLLLNASYRMALRYTNSSTFSSCESNAG